MRVKARNLQTREVDDGTISSYHVEKPHSHAKRYTQTLHEFHNCTTFTLICDVMSQDVTWLLSLASRVVGADIVLLVSYYPIPQMYVLKNTVLRSADDFHSPTEQNCWRATLNYMRTCDVHVTANKHGILFLCLKYAVFVFLRSFRNS